MRFPILPLALVGVASAAGSSDDCKTFPGDKSWPSQAEWGALNETVGGRLVATVPLGAPCHGSAFDNATCEALKSQWQYEQIQYVTFVVFQEPCTYIISAMSLPRRSWRRSLRTRAVIPTHPGTALASLATMFDTP